MLKRRSVQFLLAAAACGAVPALAQTGPQTASPAGAVPTSDIPALTATLYDPAAPADQRDQAAQRLLARPGSAARGVLQGALSAFRQPAVQLAAARALAARPTDDATLVAPLFDLFTPSSGEDLIDAAGRALTAFKHNDAVITRLVGLTAAGDERVRLAAIRAVGTFVDKKAAAALVPLIEPAAQPPRVTAAASAALAYLSGLSASTDAAGWHAWWAANGNKTDAQFEADLARDRAARYDQVRTRVTELEDEFGRTLADLYQQTPPAQRAEVLVRYLRSTEPSARVAATGIARQRAVKENTPEPVKAQLRLLIGDASPAVRRGAALALSPMNDADAVVPLITQLTQETDTSVRAALADALRPTLAQDSRGVPVLLVLLDDASPVTAQTAADALAEGGGRLRENDPALADRAADKIIAVLNARTTAQNNVELRAALVAAVAPLQNRAAAGTLVNLLNSQAEDKRVRLALLVAVGNYHNSRFTDAIAPWVRDKNDADTRRAAVAALAEAASSFGDVDRPLTDRLDQKNEPQADVRNAAWKVLAGLFPKATVAQLTFWERKLRDDPARLLVVLREQRQRARQLNDDDTVAAKNQQMGDAYLATEQFADATTAYVDAITYAQKNNKPARVEAISEGLTVAYLRNRQYAQAVNFVQQQIRESTVYQDVLGSKIKREAERLVEETKQYDAAVELIDLALKMDKPKLARPQADTLEQLRSNVINRYNKQNQSPYKSGTPVESAMLRWVDLRLKV